jgi:cellulase/cellobiase CelA1
MEIVSTNNVVISLFKREYFAPRNSVLPVSCNSDTSKCRDFDFSKVNCLSRNKNLHKKINSAKIYPVQVYTDQLPAKKDVDFIAITINNDTVDYCDMV